MHDLKAIFYMEDRLDGELRRLAGEVSNETLSEALKDHRRETVNQTERLGDIFRLLEEDIDKHEAADIRGHFQELNQLDDTITESELFDIAALNSAIKTEQMEITTYKGLLRMADELFIDEEIEELLRENLEEEEEALQKFRRLAGESWLKQVIQRFTS